MNYDYKRKLIQRWIGADQTGDLNDEATVDELLKDVSGLEAYLIDQKLEDKGEDEEVVKSYSIINHSTPNQNGNINPQGIVFHHSAGSFDGTLSWIKQARSKVSYHVLIHPDGTRHGIVPFNKRAWANGRSSFKGRSGCNDFMLSVAFSGDTNKRSLTQDELASAAEFVSSFAEHYGWTLDWMTDHRTVSPGRKNDLNPTQWKRLYNRLKGVLKA